MGYDDTILSGILGSYGRGGMCSNKSPPMGSFELGQWTSNRDVEERIRDF